TVSYRSLILNFSFLFLSMIWVQNVSATPVTISITTTWNSSTTLPTGPAPAPDYREGISIINGAELTIDGLTNFQLNDNTLISVTNGYLKIINNSIIAMGLNSYIELSGILGTPHSLIILNSEIKPKGLNWKGIILKQTFWHGTHEQQYSTYPSIDPSGNCTNSMWTGILYNNIGEVILENAKIYDAEIGIDCSPTFNQRGGVVRVRDSKFINCKKGIRLAYFYDGDYPNASFIMTTDFEWNDNISFSLNELIHIELENLYTGKLNIGGCNFYNYNSTLNYSPERGIGINAIKSEFSISKDGDKCCVNQDGKCPDNCFTNPLITQRGNKFKNLGYGIKFDGYNYGARAEKIACRYSEFSNCANSIFIENARDVVISDNYFIVNSNDFDDFFPNTFLNNTEVFDITFKNSSGVRIFDNEFTHDLEYIDGIKSDNPDLSQTSFIRKNKFYNTLGLGPLCGPHIIAIDLYGNNNHLDITCNNFIDQVYDIKVNEDATLDDVPNMADHLSNEELAENAYSSLPPETNPSIPDFQHLTLGCASNIYNETSTIAVGHRKITSSPSYNMRFHPFSHPNIKPYLKEVVQSTWSGSNCVDCSTNCDKLAIKKVQASINYIMDKGLFVLYPNPSNGQITIKLKNVIGCKNAIFKIIDLQGRTIYEDKIQNTETTLNLAQLEINEGIYTVMIHSPSMSACQKLIYFK
ncbi:MAG: T9SS type A sorting domain-containing protein, partial [Bacteroidetes bacterium]|nr:T9SS type A sorting domain-containing protein [Bacteroidota bacterium]